MDYSGQTWAGKDRSLTSRRPKARKSGESWLSMDLVL
jgi:hypothetical protein